MSNIKHQKDLEACVEDLEARLEKLEKIIEVLASVPVKSDA